MRKKQVKSEMVTIDLLGKAEVPDPSFMDYDGSYLTIDIVYLEINATIKIQHQVPLKI